MNTKKLAKVSAKEKELTAKLKKFCSENKLPHICAYDLLQVVECPDQFSFLLTFIDDWNAAKLAGEI